MQQALLSVTRIKFIVNKNLKTRMNVGVSELKKLIF